ncbi:Hypothetical protein I595_1313 [Croceitalea dokdonensis DOKDO 023]|uniref:Glycosyltransferase RgtA/B/C/D-like domain-containing protein n=1 Tax=Croceitalea dokdonensis DOKDO 023 TaxID=1300341 RepID=A0A0P7AW47_9FLAO|nr:glycosyltransferase family 39 protein [Croceitalea dokdonensis]KPM32886.1 Hypothetical protein I595_1313 [Croceitalea dokdonensis DOKDO 023]
MSPLFKKPIAFFQSFYHDLREPQLFLLLFGIAYLIRFPFFFRDYIDRDESTFIVMAQSWVDGHLPYTELWDLKPPVAFLFFAAIIYLFGKSFIAIRIGGVILVAITAIFTYKVGKRSGYKKAGFYSAFLAVVLQSLFGSLQGVMSEHICMAFFMVGLYYFMFYTTHWGALVSGLFMGLALMSKLNLGYALIFLFGLSFFIGLRKKTVPATLARLAISGTGILTVVGFTALPYALQGQTALWFASVFKAPMAYVAASDASFIKVLPYVLPTLLFLGLSLKKRWLDPKSSPIWMLIAVTLGVLFSFLQTGKANGHYLIQLYPSLLILVGAALTKMKVSLPKNYKAALLVLCVFVPMETYLEMGAVVKHKLEEGTFFNGEGIRVPHYFKTNAMETDRVLFLEYHIGYWLLDSKPPSKPATHPSNILRDQLFPFMENPRKTSGLELQFLLEEQPPEYVITRKNRRTFDKKEYRANFYITLTLANNYQPLDTVDQAIIYQRLPGQ